MTDEPIPPRSLAELRAMTDEQIVALHDRVFVSATKPHDLYIGELNRRAAEREARATRILSIIAIAIAVVAVIVAVRP